MKKTQMWGFTVDDVGYDGYSTEAHLNNILDFFDEHLIKATFFVVPEVEGKKMSARRGYVAILLDAIKRGHEVAQHGLTHDRFEVGIPPPMIMKLPHEGPARKFLAENRDKLPGEHTVAKIRQRLREGRKIMEDAIGMPVCGFRAPALQSCDNMFVALAEEKYLYDSSAWLQTAGWYTEDLPEEISREKFDRHQKPGLLELPLTADYTWRLNRAMFDREYDLAVHDYDGCLQAGIPFIPLSHVSPIQEGDDGNLGFEFFRKFAVYAKAHAAQAQRELRCLPLCEIAKGVPA